MTHYTKEELISSSDLLEHASIYQLVKNRLATPSDDYLSHDELLAQLDNQ